MFSKEKLEYSQLPLPDRQSLDDSEMLLRAQKYFKTMSTRHTVRDYTTQPVAHKVIEACVAAAGTAPSGANHQPWHFVAISDPTIKKQIRSAAEEEERKFYAGGASDEWIKALEPIGTPPIEISLGACCNIAGGSNKGSASSARSSNDSIASGLMISLTAFCRVGLVNSLIVP